MQQNRYSSMVRGNWRGWGAAAPRESSSARAVLAPPAFPAKARAVKAEKRAPAPMFVNPAASLGRSAVASASGRNKYAHMTRPYAQVPRPFEPATAGSESMDRASPASMPLREEANTTAQKVLGRPKAAEITGSAMSARPASTPAASAAMMMMESKQSAAVAVSV